MYIKTLRMFCYMKFVQHTEINNIKQGQAAGTISEMVHHHG